MRYTVFGIVEMLKLHVNFTHPRKPLSKREKSQTKIIKSSYTLKKSVFCTFLTYIIVWKIP